METPTQRLARDITIMEASGGPLSRVEWMTHLATQLAVVRGMTDSDLSPLVDRYESRARADHFLYGIEVQCAALAAGPGADYWQEADGSRALITAALMTLAFLWAAPTHTAAEDPPDRPAAHRPRRGDMRRPALLRRGYDSCYRGS